LIGIQLDHKLYVELYVRSTSKPAEGKKRKEKKGRKKKEGKKRKEKKKLLHAIETRTHPLSSSARHTRQNSLNKNT
jgi:hypothetical protein